MACDSCSTDQSAVSDTNTPLTTPLPESAPASAEPPTKNQSSSPTTPIAKQKYPISPPAVPFTPCNLFFYGSLMDTDILRRITHLSDAPVLSPGTISNFRMKMWGPFPTLIASSSPSNKVKGMYWKCEKEEQFERLRAYETDAYTWCFCGVETGSGEVLRECRTFVWSGDPEDEDLEDGSFDLVQYQKTTKGMYV